jgi:hypothetical protein
VTKGLADQIVDLIASGRSRVSDHGLRELREDSIKLRDIVAGIANAETVEEYPDYHKGPSILLLLHDSAGAPVHVLWGISKMNPDRATLITAYRPDPARWSADFLRRVRK